MAPRIAGPAALGSPPRAQPSFDTLVAAAAGGESGAWEQLVHHLMPVVVSVIGEFGLDGADGAEVNQTVWLRLVESLTRLRLPAALPAWIATTTRRECERVLRTGQRVRPVGLYGDLVGEHADPPQPRGPEDAAVHEEQCRVLREGFAQLSSRCRELLAMLLDEPPMSYQEIVARTGMRMGSIGPTHGRCLDKLRATPAVAAYLGRQRENER
jgi:RNA polymerase sigma factor (sigma-70 family)